MSRGPQRTIAGSARRIDGTIFEFTCKHGHVMRRDIKRDYRKHEHAAIANAAQMLERYWGQVIYFHCPVCFADVDARERTIRRYGLLRK